MNEARDSSANDEADNRDNDEKLDEGEPLRLMPLL